MQLVQADLFQASRSGLFVCVWVREDCGVDLVLLDRNWEGREAKAKNKNTKVQQKWVNGYGTT